MADHVHGPRYDIGRDNVGCFEAILDLRAELLESTPRFPRRLPAAIAKVSDLEETDEGAHRVGRILPLLGEENYQVGDGHVLPVMATGRVE